MLSRPEMSQGNKFDAGSFGAGLFNPSIDKPEVVVGPNNSKADKRYNVYRNNVTVSLINTMIDIFPAVQKIVGENNFRILAREYVRAHPPTSPLLFLYGEKFAEFIEAFEPTRQMPFLADIARIERGWLTAYHAADIPPLDPAMLGKVDQERLGDVTFAMHPATFIIGSEMPVQDIFMMNRGFIEVGQVDMGNAQALMLTRPETEIRMLSLDKGEHSFFQAIANGQQLGQAAAVAAGEQDTFDLNLSLQMLLGSGCTTAILLDGQKIT